MSDRSPWNLDVIEEGIATREYNSACRRVEQYERRSDSDCFKAQDLAFAQKNKDRAFVNLMAAYTKKK